MDTRYIFFKLFSVTANYNNNINGSAGFQNPCMSTEEGNILLI